MTPFTLSYVGEELSMERQEPLEGHSSAGFWVRFAAFWVDGLIVWGALSVVLWVARAFGVYVPAELFVLVFGAIYWVVLTCWRGQTMGKALCGLKVIRNNGLPAMFPRVVLRESVGKLLSVPILLLGFVWAALSKSKRAWHDFIAGTRVVQDQAKSRRARVVLGLSLSVSIVALSCSRSASPIRLASEYFAARRMAVDVDKMVTTYSQRDPSLLVEVSSLESADVTPFVQWLDENAKDPVEYAVESAAKHQITLFGELHWLRDNLAIFNRMIPDLYHRAGVTCVALECCIPQENARLARLVTAEEFDRELMLDIARRSDLWKNWGWKGYWDILETVWRLNKTLPENKKRMRVVGIGVELDGPSMAVFGFGGVSVPAPAWSKLRIFTLLDDLIRAGMSDRLYAANVARETIEKGERGVALVGAAHTSLYQLWPHGRGTRLMSERARMGFMLREKYGDQVFQIVFQDGLACAGAITQFIERVASARQHKPFGCLIKGSPFENLRDSAAGHFRLQPGLCFSDLAAGYIYLKPTAEQERCEWLDGYISEEMFAKHKRYYEAKIGKKLNSPEEANRAFKAYTGW